MYDIYDKFSKYSLVTTSEAKRKWQCLYYLNVPSPALNCWSFKPHLGATCANHPQTVGLCDLGQGYFHPHKQGSLE